MTGLCGSTKLRGRDSGVQCDRPAGHQDGCSHALIERVRRQADEIRIMQLAAERRTQELDALHLVWCDGGCAGGVHRWDDALITREVVEAAERNARRLRCWYGIVEKRLKLPGADEWQQRRHARSAAKTDLAIPPEVPRTP